MILNILAGSSIVSSVNVNFEGVIDLGPKWNNEVKLVSLDDSIYDSPTTEMRAESQKSVTEKVKQIDKKKGKGVLRTEAELNRSINEFKKSNRKPKNGLFEFPHAVSEDEKINDFTYHVYKQSLNIFDEIKKKVDPSLAHRVDVLTKNYDEKFRDFINDTMKQKIKTRLGTQRVILNTIDTSNRLLKRLVNYFIGDMQRDGVLRTNDVAVNVFLKEIERGSNLEMLHVCSKFGICRSAQGFGDFLVEVLSIILKSDKEKIKRASDALTEVLKNTDWSKIMKSTTKRKFNNKIEAIEKYDDAKVKAFFWITKNVLALKNQPITVMVTGSRHINKTVAVLEVIDELEKHLPANEENKLEWMDIRNSFRDWSAGKRKDILEIMTALISHIKKKAVDLFSDATAQNLNGKLNIIFS